MIKNFFVGILVILIAIGAAFLIHLDSGYVLIAYHGWSIETSLWIAIFLLFVSLFLIYFLFKILIRILTLDKYFQRLLKRHHNRKIFEWLHNGFKFLIEENNHSAEKNFSKIAEDHRVSFVGYLAAAYAAEKQQQHAQKDIYLSKAMIENPDEKNIIGLFKAKLEIAADQWDAAEITLIALQTQKENHAVILKLLALVYQKQKKWKELSNLLASLKKSNILSKLEYEKLSQQAYASLIEESHLTQARNIWDSLDKSLRYSPKIVVAYIRQLMKFNQESEAVPIIEHTLKKQWDSDLVMYYGKISGSDIQKQLNTAETWLKNHPNDPQLLLCVAQLSMHQKFWGKAKEYLEAATKINPSSETYYELAKLYEALGNKDLALKYYSRSE